MKCLFCRNKKKIKLYKLPLFRHLDFNQHSQKTKFIFCKKCGHLSTANIKRNQFLKTSQYANSNQTNRNIFIKNKPIKDRTYFQTK